MKCLIVDDSATMRRILHNALDGMGFNECVEATCGREALRSLRDQSVDVMVTGSRMPSMNGIELVRQLRMNPATAQLAVLMVTTSDSREEVLEAVRAGVNEYLV